jgi:hypothetical protein
MATYVHGTGTDAPMVAFNPDCFGPMFQALMRAVCCTAQPLNMFPPHGLATQ